MVYIIISFFIGGLLALAIPLHYVNKLKAGGDKTLVEELHRLREENWDLQTENHWLRIANQTKYDEGFEDGNISAVKTVGRSLLADHKKLEIKKEGVENGDFRRNQICEA